MSDPPTETRVCYRAFISYSHGDDRAYAWGRSLHKALEYFPVTARIRKESKLGECPRYIRRVFLDKDELPIQADLGEQIHTALQHSAHLIVICSPAVGESRWINEEVRYFQELGREASINAYLVGVRADVKSATFDKNLPPTLRAMNETWPVERAPLILDARSDERDQRWFRRTVISHWPKARYWLSEPHIAALCHIVAILLQVEYTAVQQEYRRWRTQMLLFVLVLVSLGVMLPFGLIAHGYAVISARQAREQYRTDIAVVANTWETGQAIVARKLLLAAGASPYRGAEWRYLQHQQALCRYVLTAHGMTPVDRINYSPDGKRILTCGGDHAAKVWDSKTGKRIIAMEPSSGYLVDAAFLSNDRVVTVNQRGTVEAWMVDGGTLIHASESGVSYVVRIACSPDGEFLALGDKGGQQWLMRMAGDVATLLPANHQGTITELAFSCDGRLIATAGADAVVAILQTGSRTLIQSLVHPSPVKSVCFSRDRQRLLTSCDDGKARIWNLLESGNPREIALGSAAPSIAFSPEDNWAITGDAYDTIRVWNSETGVPLLTMRGHAGPVTAIACAPDGKSIASGDSSGELRIWRLAPDYLPNATPETSLTVSADGGRYFLGNSGEVRSLPKHGLVLKVPLAPRPMRRGAFSPDQTHLLVTDEDAPATVWNLSTGKPERRISLLGEQHVQAVYLTDGRAFITCGRQSVVLWDAVNYNRIRTLASGEGLEGIMAVSPDGRQVAVARGTTVEVIAVATGLMQGRRRLPAGAMIGLAYSSDGTRLAASAFTPYGDTVAYIFSGDAEAPMLKISETGRNLSAAAFLDRGARIVTSWNHALTIWDSETGNIMLRIPLEDPRGDTTPAPESLQQLVVSNDECRIFVTGRVCRQWFIPPTAAGNPNGRSDP